MNPANLRPLPLSRSSANPTIFCLDCGEGKPYHDAARVGWFFDPTGPSFRAYYCPDCASKPAGEVPR